MKTFAAILFAAGLAGAAPAGAQEAISTNSGAGPAAEAPAPPLASPDRDQRQANGDWARRVMAGQPSADDRDADAAAKGCQRNPDRAPHGEVWAGVGTGGYNTVGAVVTQPIGDCAQATVAVSRTEGGRVPRGRRR
jgi:hypothetical protein